MFGELLGDRYAGFEMPENKTSCVLRGQLWGGGGGGDDSKPSVGDRMGDAQIKTRRR